MQDSEALAGAHPMHLSMNILMTALKGKDGDHPVAARGLISLP